MGTAQALLPKAPASKAFLVATTPFIQQNASQKVWLLARGIQLSTICSLQKALQGLLLGAAFLESQQKINVDTTYSTAWLDLSEDALAFHRPGANRFLSVALLDAYTNAPALLGTGGDTQEARTYVLAGPEHHTGTCKYL